MAVAPTFSFSDDFHTGLDELLFQVCDELQLPPARHDLAVQRYEALGDVLESERSPFRLYSPNIYPQGSMALVTTVKPVEGPHDLDFVLELSLAHNTVNPMRLINALFEFLRGHGVYGPMTTPKRRCVRVKYADDFYMDILPACRNGSGVGTSIKVPDRAIGGWTDSDPLGYISWFDQRCRVRFVARIMDKAAPVPAQQAVAEKKPLQLAVQLLKRWRDLHYANGDPDLAPISIVLTTLAGHAYRGERSVSRGLTEVLGGIVGFMDDARRRGARLQVLNPTNDREDLSERWDTNPSAYLAFETGMRGFRDRWSRLIARGGNVDAELELLFGEPPVKAALKKRAQRLQESRLAGGLGVTGSGIITSSRAGTLIRPNTFYGDE